MYGLQPGKFWLGVISVIFQIGFHYKFSTCGMGYFTQTNCSHANSHGEMKAQLPSAHWPDSHLYVTNNCSQPKEITIIVDRRACRFWLEIMQEFSIQLPACAIECTCQYNRMLFTTKILSSCICLLLQGHKKVGDMWKSSGLRWSDFLPQGQDVNKFVQNHVSLTFSISNQLL